MKNIHILSTNKPSKLLKDIVDKTYQLKKEVTFGNRIELPLNIYITSDEEIKEGDCTLLQNSEHKHIVETYSLNSKTEFYRKKIILTTDQDLIKDGVQAIDDEFLEWFVKNPSCESVEIYNWLRLAENKRYYEAAIPKEEPIISYTNTNDCTSFIYDEQEEPKQETLEEYAERYSEEYFNRDEILMRCSKISFIDGYKLAQEQFKNK